MTDFKVKFVTQKNLVQLQKTKSDLIFEIKNCTENEENVAIIPKYDFNETRK